MKILFGLFFSFILLQNSFAQLDYHEEMSTFASLRSEKNVYQVGEQAVLSAFVNILPTNPAQEVYLQSRFDSKSIELIQLTQRESVAVTPQFVIPGTYTWRVDVFFQDRLRVQEVNESISFYQLQINQIDRLLAVETNPATRQLLIEQKQRNNDFIKELKKTLPGLRVKVDTVQLEIIVEESSVLSLYKTSYLVVEANRSNHQYDIGEYAVFSIKVLGDFQADDGEQEIIIRTRLKNKSLGVVALGDRDFLSTSNLLMAADVGENQFRATLQIRSKFRSDSLREAVIKAKQRRAEFVEARSQTDDPMSQAYFDIKIAELTKIISALNKILEDLLITVEHKSIVITVKGENSPPIVGADQSFQVAANQAFDFEVSVASDPDADELEYIVTTAPLHGSLSNCLGLSIRNCTYTPNPDFVGADQMSYKVNDGQLDSLNTATVVFNIELVNSIPQVGENQSFSLNEDTSLEFIVSEGIDADGDELSYFIVTSPTHGQLINCFVEQSRECTYVPASNFYGEDSFSYKVTDGQAESLNVAVVSFNVVPVNDPPLVGEDQSFETFFETSIIVEVNEGSDIDSDLLSYFVFENPANGLLLNCFNSGRLCEYIPNDGFTGIDSFKYKVFDGEDESEDFATVTIDVKPSANLVMSPALHQFGAVEVGHSSIEQVFTLENTGESPALGCSSPTLSGADANDFTLISGTNCSASLQPQESCNFSLTFSPLVTSGAKQASVNLECGSLTASSALEGEALILLPELSWSVLDYNFGAVLNGSESEAVSFTFQNIGDATATGCSDAILLGDNANQFQITSNDCTEATLGVGMSCTVNVKAVVSELGSLAGQLQRSCDFGGVSTVDISVQGVFPQLGISTEEHHFGDVDVNSSSAPFVFTLTNTGTAAATSCSAPILTGLLSEEFAVVSDTCLDEDLAQNASCEFSVLFQPSSAGAFQAQVERSCAIGGFNTASISGNGVAVGPANLSFTPSSYHFGTVPVGESSSVMRFTLSNEGESSALSCAYVLNGANSADFTIAGTTTCSNGNLGAGQSCFIDVSFSPLTASLNKEAFIDYNCSAGVSAILSLAGQSPSNSFAANDFSFDTLNPVNPYGVFFEAESEVHPNGHEIESVIWDFGDGSPLLTLPFNDEEDFQFVFHYFIFPEATKDFTVTKTLVDVFGNTAYFQDTITLVKGRAPVINFTADAFVITEGGTINFDGSASYDPDGAGNMMSIMGFGDGQEDESIDGLFSYQYTVPGIFDLTFGLMTPDNHINFFEDYLKIYVDEPNGGQIPFIDYFTSDLIGAQNLVIEFDSSENSFDVDGTIERTIIYTQDPRFGFRYYEGPVTQIEYIQNGNFALKALGFDNDGHVSRNDNFREVFVWDDLMPEVEFFIFPGFSGTNTIIAYALNTSTGAIYTDGLSWDFGDGLGVQSSEGYVEYFYNLLGTYTVTLSARGINGHIVSKSKTIELSEGGLAPLAEFSFDLPNPIQLGSVVSFDSLDSSDLNDEENPVSFYWNFGDGTRLITADKVVQHQYIERPRHIDVELFVENAPPPIGNGLATRTSQRLNIVDGPVATPGFEWIEDENNFLALEFDSSSSILDPLKEYKFVWEIIENGKDVLFSGPTLERATEVFFGNVVSHVFSTAGVHEVILNIIDPDGNVVRLEQSVPIIASQPFISVIPDITDFGNMNVSEPSFPATEIIFQNTGDLEAIGCLDPQLKDGHLQDFEIISHTCSSETMQSMESCSAQVVFTPQEVGYREASLSRQCTNAVEHVGLVIGTGVQSMEMLQAKKNKTRKSKRKKSNAQILDRHFLKGSEV